MKIKGVILIVILVIVLGLVGYRIFFMKNKTTEPVPVQGKLNIEVVCQSALSYMTFPDGASADKFVAECKDGKHPEVIERYKADSGLGDGAAI